NHKILEPSLRGLHISLSTYEVTCGCCEPYAVTTDRSPALQGFIYMNSSSSTCLRDKTNERFSWVPDRWVVRKLFQCTSYQEGSRKQLVKRIGQNFSKCSKCSACLVNRDKIKQLILKNKAELEDCRRSIISLRQLHGRFQREVSEELNTCREQTVRLLKEYKTQLSCYSDPTLRSIRTDRASLDRMLTELREARTSLGEQLHDLECVIEQTGNDVLQHRCRITLPYVQTLDVRLDSISRAVGSTSATYPDIRQRLSKQEEAELRAIDMEKRQVVLDEQLHQLEDMGEKCKRIKGTILTLRRLAIVNGQNRQQASSPRRFAHLGGVMNRAAADPNSLERTRLYAAIKAIQPNSERRMQAIQCPKMSDTTDGHFI
ncbi:hypothetical protein CLF_111382, partial [Clonorchis sinensis]